MNKRIYLTITIIAIVFTLWENHPGQQYSDLTNDIETGKYGVIDAYIIATEDSILYEKYFNSFEKDQLHKCYSVTKSITSLLYGIAYKNNELPDLESPIINFFPKYKHIFLKDQRKTKITLYNLFTMTAGFEWDEFGGVPKKYSESEDFIGSILEIPLDSEPGTKFTYNTGVSILLGEILKRITHRNYDEILKSELFDKLDINNYKLHFIAPGIPNSGGGLEMQARDLIKIGQMLLKNGDNIIPAEWINISTAKYVERGERSDYGFQWWRYDNDNPIAKKLKTNDIYFASGFGGQFLWIIPHWNITIVSFAKNFQNGKEGHQILSDHIINIFEK